MVENSRNGSTPKPVRTEIGDVTIAGPRDREGSFEPMIVRKHQRRLAGFDEAVISVNAKGMTAGDIVNHLSDVDHTDGHVPGSGLQGHQPGPDRHKTVAGAAAGGPVYPVVLIDAVVPKICEGNVATETQ